MKNVIYYDGRWLGEHGIGRFAAEVKKIDFDLIDLPINGNPASKFDVFLLTKFLFRNKGYFFSPGYNSPLFFLRRSVITVHDLNHIDLDYNSSFLKKIYYNFILKRACVKCAKILTVSDFSKKRIIEWSGVNEGKVVVVGNGVSDEFEESGEKHLPGYPYVLVVGNRKKHKNEYLAIKAFLASDISADVKLVLTGDESQELRDLLTLEDAGTRVIFSGRLSNEKLASMYRGAICLLFPSLYEGFGLPVIEAMACGTPVITSNTTSLYEVAGSAACFVEPENIASITHGINLVTGSESYRNELTQRGYVNVKNYTWEKTRNSVLIALRDVLKLEGKS